MEILYPEHPEMWEAMAIPEKVESFGYGSTDGPLMCVSLRPKNGEDAVFSSVPTSVFLVFKAKWDALIGGITTGRFLKS